MSGRATEFVAALTAFLKEHGAEVLSVDYAHKHPRIYFRHNGIDRFYVTANTPSDRRSLQCALSDLRHMLGLVGGPKRTGRRRIARNRADEVAAAPPPQITAGGNPFAVLNHHALADEVDRIRFRAAWQAIWDRHLVAACGEWPWWRITKPAHLARAV